VDAGKDAKVEQDPVPERSKVVMTGGTPLDTIWSLYLAVSLRFQESSAAINCSIQRNK
jgi:hypothetical protein